MAMFVSLLHNLDCSGSFVLQNLIFSGHKRATFVTCPESFRDFISKKKGFWNQTMSGKQE